MSVVRRRRRVGRRKLQLKKLWRALGLALPNVPASGAPPERRRRVRGRKVRLKKLGQALSLARPGDLAAEGANIAAQVRRRRRKVRRKLRWKKLGRALSLILVGALAVEGANIALQSFEGLISDTWAFVSSPDPYNTEGSPIVLGGNENVWAPIQAFTNRIDAAADGSIFWGGQDLDNPIASGDHTLAFSDVDISEFSAVQVSFQYNFDGLDSADSLQYRMVFDGVVQPWTLLTATGNNQSSGGWQTVSVAVPSLVSLFGLEVVANQDGPSEHIGLDDFRVEGTPEVPESATVLLVGLGLVGLGFAHRRRLT